MRWKYSPTLLPVALLSTVFLAGCSSTPAPTTTRTVTQTAAPAPSSSDTSTPTTSCGPATGSAAAASAIAGLPAPAGLDGVAWDASTADYSGYEPCAALSWSVVTLVGSTSSSPYAILLFHDGRYLGTATSTPYAFTPEIRRATADTIDVSYRYAEKTDANADPTGRAQARFTWNDDSDRVVMTGSVPPTS